MGLFKKKKLEQGGDMVDAAEYLEGVASDKDQKTGKPKERRLPDDESQKEPTEKAPKKEETHAKQEINETDTLTILEKLKADLNDFEKIREVLKAKVESTSRLVPKLNEKKELLGKAVHEQQEKVAEIDELVPKLERKRVDLQEEMQQKRAEIELLEKAVHEQQEKIAEINELMPKLDRQRDKIQKIVQEKQAEVSRITEQTNQMMTVQKYGVDLLSTLVYSNKRNR